MVPSLSSNRENFWLVAIVAIVAIIGLVTLYSFSVQEGKESSFFGEQDGVFATGAAAVQSQGGVKSAPRAVVRASVASPIVSQEQGVISSLAAKEGAIGSIDKQLALIARLSAEFEKVGLREDVAWLAMLQANYTAHKDKIQTAIDDGSIFAAAHDFAHNAGVLSDEVGRERIKVEFPEKFNTLAVKVQELQVSASYPLPEIKQLKTFEAFAKNVLEQNAALQALPLVERYQQSPLMVKQFVVNNKERFDELFYGLVNKEQKVTSPLVKEIMMLAAEIQIATSLVREQPVRTVDAVPVTPVIEETVSIKQEGMKEKVTGAAVLTETGSKIAKPAKPAKPITKLLLCPDADKDGFPMILAQEYADFKRIPRECVRRGNDCDDDNPLVNPKATEVCNGIDDNCDGIIDGKTVSKDVCPVPVCEDADKDGYQNNSRPALCRLTTKADCNDNNNRSNPSPSITRDVCDGLDNNCDGIIDGNQSDYDSCPTCRETDAGDDPQVPGINTLSIGNKTGNKIFDQCRGNMLEEISCVPPAQRDYTNGDPFPALKKTSYDCAALGMVCVQTKIAPDPYAIGFCSQSCVGSECGVDIKPEHTIGVKKVIVLLIDDWLTELDPNADLQVMRAKADDVTKEVSQAMSEMSYGKLDMKFDVCEISGSGIKMPTTITEAVTAAIQLCDPQVNFLDYEITVLYPTFFGGAMGGAGAMAGAVSTVTDQGRYNSCGVFIDAPPLYPFIELESLTFSHEIGHCFSLPHATGHDCGYNSYGPLCTKKEYGDLYDVMGSSNLLLSMSVFPHFNCIYKEELGWVNTLPVSVGTHTIASLEYPSTLPQCLTLNMDQNLLFANAQNNTMECDKLYLEYRTPRLFIGNNHEGVALHCLTTADLNNRVVSGNIDCKPNTVYTNGRLIAGLDHDFKDSLIDSSFTCHTNLGYDISFKPTDAYSGEVTIVNAQPSYNCVDADNDGYQVQNNPAGCTMVSQVDCNDDDWGIKPSNAEKCGDNVDNNCNGAVDEACP